LPNLSDFSFAEYVAKLSDANPRLDLGELPVQANKATLDLEEIMRRNADLFSGVYKVHQWTLFNFYESKENLTRYGLSVVSSTSPIASILTAFHWHDQITSPATRFVRDNRTNFLPGDHITMCRFQTPEDKGFLAVSEKLMSMISNKESAYLNDYLQVPDDGQHKRSAILEASQTYRRK
jgi:hypothetical protein